MYSIGLSYKDTQLSRDWQGHVSATMAVAIRWMSVKEAMVVKSFIIFC
jgi:hypothetical protein